MIHYYNTAAYIRLSREDGDKAESDSITKAGLSEDDAGRGRRAD